jgi:monovalent cation:H+ antiporter-2, CPA2 family
MHSVAFLQDLAIVMIVAAIVTILFHRLRQPVVLGYILAGVIIGPHTPPVLLLNDQKTIETLSELGVVFLMFSLGLEFSFRKLTKVGFTAIIAATLEILLMIWVGYVIGRAFGWKPMDCLFLGAMLSISSTTIIVKALNDLGLTKQRFAELIFGILIVEDILAIILIALLSGIAQTGEFAFGEVLKTTGRLVVFLAVALVLGLLAVPRLLRYVSGFKSNEMLLVTVLGLCFGVSLLAVKLEYSVALGAFIIGAVIAEAREIHRIEALTEPIRICSAPSSSSPSACSSIPKSCSNIGSRSSSSPWLSSSVKWSPARLEPSSPATTLARLSASAWASRKSANSPSSSPPLA